LQKQMNRKIGVLISGRGSNLRSIIDATKDGRLDAEIAVVVSNRSDAKGLQLARAAGIECLFINHLDYDSREEFDRVAVKVLRSRDVRLVCLAGFMRLLSVDFINAFPNGILNIHPSLLPAFPGLNAQKQAFDYGVRLSGATVHIVTAELDNGPIVSQAVVQMEDDDTAETLAARILEQEHRIYPEAIDLVLGGQWRIEGRRFVVIKTDDD